MLTKPQLESRVMKELRLVRHLERGIVIYTAFTMEEQRVIAEYLNQMESEEYEIVDFSQKEQHLMNNTLTRNVGPKLIISNMQEIGVAPYCMPDEKATVTLQDKIEWMNRIRKEDRDRNEASILQFINMARDGFFRERKVICGMHPNFLEKMEHMPYYSSIDDWLDYVSFKIKFNEDPEFTQCLPITNFQGNHQLQVHDKVFFFQNKVVRWPEFDIYSRLTGEEYHEKLQQLPEIHFPIKEEHQKERE